MTKRRVVITGMGTINPIAHDPDQFYDALIEGKNGVATLDGWPTEHIPSKMVGQIKNLDLDDHFGPKEIRRTARFTQIAIIAARQALTQAGVALQPDGNGLDRDRVGVSNGTSLGSFTDMVAQILSGGENHDRVSPFFVARMLPNMPGAGLAMEFGFRGHNDTSVTACAASTQSIGNALRVIQYGDADAMLAGGCEANISDWGIATFTAMKAMSTRNDDPEHAMRPFDMDRDGFAGAEGAGYLFLESEEHAQARGAQIIAEVAGFASTDDAYHQVMPKDDGYGAALAMERALKDAGVAPDEVGYINAHGTSTQLNDKAETAAIKKAFGGHAYRVPISSTKSMIGHVLGGAGGVEAVATTLCLTRGTLHPTINYLTPDPDCDLDYIPNTARKADVDVAISNSFGFGGQNAVLVFKRYRG
ncbi:MAG TPA: beta-ketoacyl-ACP synthase II [Candidatus Dormibacteraeota bacterium]|jgi:3-oxoacyl-[acyl-carrier-protein] synthase II